MQIARTPADSANAHREARKQTRNTPKAKERRAARAAQAAARAATVLAADGLLRLPEVLSVYPVSASTWWAGIRAQRYPQPIKIGPRATAWRAADIRELIARESIAKAAQ